MEELVSSSCTFCPCKEYNLHVNDKARLCLPSSECLMSKACCNSLTEGLQMTEFQQRGNVVMRAYKALQLTFKTW